MDVKEGLEGGVVHMVYPSMKNLNHTRHDLLPSRRHVQFTVKLPNQPTVVPDAGDLWVEVMNGTPQGRMRVEDSP
jgi:hypothetical protein